MVTYNFSEQLGQTISNFDIDADVLSFASADGSANDVTVTISGNDLVFTTIAGSVTRIGITLSQITTTNVTFADGSKVEVGDNATGTSGDESAQTITGTTNDDQLFGQGGADSLGGAAGNDVLFGGEGNDSFAGGAGDDFIQGNRGDDNIVGAASNGNDTVRGGQDYDTINYSAATVSNQLWGDRGADTIDGGTAADTIFGGADADTIKSPIGMIAYISYKCNY